MLPPPHLSLHHGHRHPVDIVDMHFEKRAAGRTSGTIRAQYQVHQEWDTLLSEVIFAWESSRMHTGH